MADFRFPGPRDRVTINGMTGSGKSTFAMWLFAMSADFDKKPWILVDYKGEDIISAIKGVVQIKPSDAPPKKPGVYVLHPGPHDTEEMKNFLWKVWKQGKTGLFFDEVYMVPEFKGDAGSGGPLKAILTQGRSLEIPVYALAQRPVDVNRHVYTEATFYSSFRLRSRKDYERILDFVPEDKIWSDERPLPDHWSKWYDAPRNVSFILKPSPPSDVILDLIDERLEKLKEKEKL